MPLEPITRPHIPYKAKKLANYDRYQMMKSLQKPPTAETFDADFDALVDGINDTRVAVNVTQAKGLTGYDQAENKEKLVTTDGDGHISWTYVKESNLENEAVKTKHLGPRAVTTGKMEFQSVKTDVLADIAVTTEKINNGAVTTPKLAPGNVTQACMANDSVGTAQVIDTNITEPKLGNLAVTTPKVADNAITMQKLAANVTLEIMKVIFPIGSVYICFANQNPPFHGVGITWTLLDEGRAVMTGNAGNTGTTAGANRLDNGNTNGHAITVQQMPAHTHTANIGVMGQNGFNSTTPVVKYCVNTTVTTSSTGNNEPHAHALAALNYKLLFYRRAA